MRPSKKEVQTNYNRLGHKIYDKRYKQEQKIKYAIVLKKVNILKNELVLDHGCGTGLFIKLLENPIVGIDNSSGLLNGALENVKRKENKHLVQGDVDHLPFRDNIFQKLFSFTVIQNLNNPSDTFIEILRVTKGLKIITVLKKAYNKKKLISLIKELRLQNTKIIDKVESKDWLLLIQ
jgi:ubiquinone/menaquinone biosynthesis C-methylase UbiE